MRNNAVKTIPEVRAATPAEIEEAIAALSEADWTRLSTFAKWKVVPLQRRVPDCQGNELLNEAFKRLLSQSRKWDKSKDGFMEFLLSAMESIANIWMRQTFTAKGKTLLFSTLTSEIDEGETSSPVDNLEAADIDTSHMLICKETLEKIDAFIQNEGEDVRALFEGMREGYAPPDIRDLWGWSQEKYNAVVLKMRRHLERAGITDPTREKHHVQ